MKLILAALALPLLPACNIEAGNNALPYNGLAEFEGERCKVQLRRDFLGAETVLPIPPLTDVYNGAPVSIAGRLEDVDHNGVVLRSDGRDLWIPMEAILLIDLDPGTLPPSALGQARAGISAPDGGELGPPEGGELDAPAGR